MKRWVRRWRGVALVTLAAVLAAWAPREHGLFHVLHLRVFDLHTLFAPTRVPPDVLLLLVDRKTIEQYPEPLLFWHRYYAEAIRTAAAHGAKVFGLDVALAIPVEQWAPGLDQELAAALLENSPRMPVVCASAGPLTGRQREWPVPFNMACAALGGMGYVNLRADADDFIRSIEVRSADGGMPSFPLLIAERFKGASIKTPGRVVRIRHAGPAGTVRRVSLADFLQAAGQGDTERLLSWVRNKAVILGPDLITDRHATPHYAFRPGTPANTSGAEIQASAVDTLLSGRYLLDVAEPWSLTALTSVAALTAVAATLWSGWPMLLATGGVGLAAAAMSHALFLWGRVLPTFEILFAWLLSLLLTLGLNYATASRRGRLLHGAMSLFVGRGVADTLAEEGAAPGPGKREVLTILFSDIRGFTAYCESHSPLEVVAGLNRYFGVMTGLVVKHGGQVNKFVGDGMLAIFSSSDGQDEDHALRAVRCAREMILQDSEFVTGAGVHTGEAVVGVVGSGDKLEYTVLGDAVNLAARLESLNPQLNTRLLISAATAERVGTQFAFRSLGNQPVKGKTADQAVYTIEWDSAQ